MSKRLIKKINLQGNELIIDIIRPSLWHFLGQMAVATILLLLPFFLIYPLFSYGVWGLATFSLILILALVLICRLKLIYDYNALIITDKRMVDIEQLGFFNSVCTVILYSKIREVNYQSKGFLAALFRLGNIRISLINDDNSFIELTAIKYPSLVVSKIIKQRESYLAAQRQIAGDEAVRLLSRIKKKLGEDEFNRLVF